MMNTMHIGSDDKPSQIPVKFRRKKNIAVIEHRGGVEQNLENDHRYGRSSDNKDNRKFYGHGKQYLNCVKAGARGDIEVQVCLVHAMEAPERRNCMKHH